LANVSIYYHPKQAEFLTDPARVKVVLKGRRFGGTHGLANHVSECLLDGKYRRVLWGDVSLGNTKRYWSRFFNPIWKNVNKSLWTYGKQDNEFRYRDSYIDFRGADYPDGWEGFGYDCIVLNEAGIILKNDYLWYNAVLPMSLEHKADIFILGTPKGKRGIYYELSEKARKGEDGWKLFTYTSYDNPLIAAEDIKEMELSMPEIQARQEIYAEFIDDTGSVFRNISECATSVEESPKEDEDYYMGLDLARTQDYTVIKILTKEGREVYHERFNQVEWAYQKERAITAAQRYNNASILMDATGVGDVIFEDLQNAGLNITPFVFNNERKFNLVKNLIMAFENKKISIIPDSVTLAELKNFEYSITNTGKVKYEARSGHDDTVMSLALAYSQINQAGIPTIRQIPEPKQRQVGNVLVSGGKWKRL